MDRILQRFSNVIILTLIIIVRAPPSPFATCRETGWDETAANKKKVDEIVANQGATAVIIIYLLLLPHNLRLTPPPPPRTILNFNGSRNATRTPRMRSSGKDGEVHAGREVGAED